MNKSKLKARPFSKSSAEREDRAYCRCIGKKYPIHTKARMQKKQQQAALFEELSDICPC